MMEQEDDYRFARRRAAEGAKDDAIIGELAIRGVDRELALCLVRNVRDERRRWRGSVPFLVAGIALLVCAGFLFYLDTTEAFRSGSLPFSPWVAKGVGIVGGLVFVKGLFG